MRVTWQLWIPIVLLVILAAGLAFQRQTNRELCDMIGVLRDRNQELGRLQTERGRLLKAQISAAELESLRADHAAVTRLRGEIETAKARLKEIEGAEAGSAPHP